MSMTNATTVVRARPMAVAWRLLAAPVALYAVALLVRLGSLIAVPFPLTEGSAYYVAVARNMAEGRGTVIDALWSYATPPLTLPRQAFELWQPMASVIAAWPMHFFGTSFASAQLGFALFGALLAPLAWWVARDAARRLDLPGNRQTAVAVGSGLLVAVGAPFVLATAVPDSTLPFTVLAVAACVAMPAAARGNPRVVLALGLLLGLTYLTRMEAVYLGVVFVALAWTAGVRGRQLVGRVGAVAAIGALVALPWWLRNIAAFGTPMPGQLADNAFLTSNAQIFAWTEKPTLSGFLGQGPATILANVGAGAWHNFVVVLLIPGTALAAVGLLTLVLGWRRRSAFAASPLWAVLVFGAIAFAITTLLFPVATLWGTFEHASGPLLVGLAVLAVGGGDAFVARVRIWRRWERPNAWMAPAALISLAVVMTCFQVFAAGGQAMQRERQIAAAGAVVRQIEPVDTATPVITDRPIWLSDSLGVPTLALPVESPASVLDLARTFGAAAVVVVDGDVTNADALLTDPTGCFQPGLSAELAEMPPVTVINISESCR
jgi:4-amino-4-deoxy-L-arabinose transferase-like glycosyltransferase